jgi:hypothetical protein
MTRKRVYTCSVWRHSLNIFNQYLVESIDVEPQIQTARCTYPVIPWYPQGLNKVLQILDDVEWSGKPRKHKEDCQVVATNQTILYISLSFLTFKILYRK